MAEETALEEGGLGEERTEDEQPDLFQLEPEPEFVPELDDGAQEDDRIAALEAEIARLSQRAQLVDAFEADPNGTMRQVAERLNMELVPKTTASNGTGAESADGPPQSVIDSVVSNLPAEMQFMGPSVARAAWIANRAAIEPFEQQRRAETQRTQLAERNRIAAEMDAAHPNWRGSIGDMENLYSFVQSAVNGGSMQHPQYGSLQEMLLKIVSGDKTAVTAAASRMRNAGRNATSVSGNEAPSSVDVGRQIDKAATPEEQIRIAWRAALAENGVG